MERIGIGVGKHIGRAGRATDRGGDWGSGTHGRHEKGQQRFTLVVADRGRTGIPDGPVDRRTCAHVARPHGMRAEYYANVTLGRGVHLGDNTRAVDGRLSRACRSHSHQADYRNNFEESIQQTHLHAR